MMIILSSLIKLGTITAVLFKSTPFFKLRKSVSIWSFSGQCFPAYGHLPSSVIEFADQKFPDSVANFRSFLNGESLV